jgi:hypothetical protein
MNGNEAEFQEAIRLIRKFFPESKAFISAEGGIDIYSFIRGMSICGLKEDYSCEHFGVPPGPNLGLHEKGGFLGSPSEILKRLLEHAEFSPSGRVIIIPDAVAQSAWSLTGLRPVVCDFKRVFERIEEMGDYLDSGSCDSIFVFESGEAIAVDHDNRVFWAKSKERMRKRQ